MSIGWQIRKGPNDLWITFTGVVNEHFQPDALIADVGDGAAQIVLDTAGLKRFSSEGIRRWIKAVHDLGALGAKVIYTRCSVALVAQMNMIPNVAEGVGIYSVHAPYYSDGAGEEAVRLLVLNEIDLAKPPVFEEDGHRYELDDEPSSYFAFLNDERVGVVEDLSH